MLIRIYVGFIVLFSSIVADSISFEDAGIPIKILDSNAKIKEIIVKRDIPEVCKNVPINNQMVWTGDYAHEKVPKECKSTYVHTTGKLLPIQIHENVDTYGELEVLAFIKHMQTDDSMLLIDGRKQSWFDYRTIPGAINIPFHHLKERDAFEFEFEHALTMLGVKIDEDENETKVFDFSKAKTIAIFCNGPWCTQSVAMINALINIGYPEDKMKWYRGGMQTWLAAGMTSTRK